MTNTEKLQSKIARYLIVLDYQFPWNNVLRGASKTAFNVESPPSNLMDWPIDFGAMRFFLSPNAILRRREPGVAQNNNYKIAHNFFKNILSIFPKRFKSFT